MYIYTAWDSGGANYMKVISATKTRVLMLIRSIIIDFIHRQNL